jgi:hypothetical protein
LFYLLFTKDRVEGLEEGAGGCDSVGNEACHHQFEALHLIIIIIINKKQKKNADYLEP